MSDAVTPPLPADPNDRAFLGHPKGLGFLAFTEAWERFSYYGMQTLLVLYMTKHLLLPGHVENIAAFEPFRRVLDRVYQGPLSTVALASAIFGLYAGLVYLTPILGGLIADRWLGRTRTVILGALLMSAGHFLMAFEVSFLFALLCLLFGVGCFKGNLASQIGALYAPEDLRRADAFQIYYLFINGAVIASPLITGTLGELYGWHYGFGAAGVGMVLGLVIYLSGRRWLPPEPARAAAAGENPPLSRDEWRTIAILIVLLPVLALGTVGNMQIFNAYMVWVPDNINLVFFGRTMPTTWLITLDSIVGVSFLGLSLGFWRLWAKRFKEPSEVVKMTIGTFLSALGVLCLVGGALAAGPGQKAGIGWVLGFELLNSAGFSNLLPVGLALYVRVAPKAVSGTILGVYFLHLFASNMMVGWLGGLLDKMSGAQFWLLHAGLVAGSGVVLIAAHRLFGHLLNPQGAPAAGR